MHVYDLVSRDGDRSFYFILFFDDEVQIKYLKLWIRLKSNLYQSNEILSVNFEWILVIPSRRTENSTDSLACNQSL